MDLSAVLQGMVLYFGSRNRLTGDGYIIASVTPNGSSGGSITLVDPVPTVQTNVAFIVDTRDFNGSASNYLIAAYTMVLNTLLRLTSPLTNLYSGSRTVAFDKDTAAAISRLIYAIGGRLWFGAEQRTVTYTPTGGVATPIETFGLRTFPDGTTPFDSILIDGTTGGVDVAMASATMTANTTVDLAAAPMGKVLITGAATITSFGSGKHKTREVHFQDDGAVLTHNATSLILPGKANLTMRAGDMLRTTSDSSGNWRVRGVTRADASSLDLNAPETTLPSQATVDLGASNTRRVAISGTTAITSFGSRANVERLLRFTGAMVLTHNAASLNLPGGQNITTAAGDRAWAVSDASGNFIVLDYVRADGTPVVTVPVANGGTGSTTASGARGNLGAAASGANGDITSLSGLTTALSVGQGGTGANNVPGARGNLGLNTTGAVSFRNRIINGNFAINQRGYASGGSLGSGAFGHDRWKDFAGGSSYTFTPGTPDTTITISSGSLLQPIEATLIEGGNYVLSWAGTAQMGLKYTTPGNSSVQGPTGASPLSVSGVPAGSLMYVYTVGTGTLGLVQFEPGTVATAFERRDDELRRCQRYFQSYGGLPNDYVGSGYTSGFAHIGFKFQTRMRATPSFAISNIAGIIIFDGVNNYTPTGLAFANVSPDGVNFGLSASGLTSGRASLSTLQSSSVANSTFLTLNAEL